MTQPSQHGGEFREIELAVHDELAVLLFDKAAVIPIGSGFAQRQKNIVRRDLKCRSHAPALHDFPSQFKAERI